MLRHVISSRVFMRSGFSISSTRPSAPFTSFFLRRHSSSPTPPPSSSSTSVSSPISADTDKNLQITFNCNVCNATNTKKMSKKAYTKGLVIIICDGCKSKHLIADNLGWFDSATKSGNFNLAEALAEKGEVIRTGVMELDQDLIDGTGEGAAKPK